MEGNIAQLNNARRAGRSLRVLLLGAAASLSAGMGALAAEQPAPPPADPASLPQDETSVREVVVTARRRDENLQQVPSAVTAISGETLRSQQIQSFTDVKNNVPNLAVQTQFGQPSTPQIYMRGVATGLLTFTVDAPVGMYLDGVYLGRAVGAGFGIADIERLEVLRGPQGTLFGRNATGGAINFVTKGPTGQFGGEVEASFGNYDYRRFRASVDLPEVNDFAAKLTYVRTDHDGYVKNSGPQLTWSLPAPFGVLRTASTYGYQHQDAVFVAARYTGVEDLTVDYRFDYSRAEESQLAVQFLGSAEGDFGDALRQASNANGGVVPAGTTRFKSLPLGFNTEGVTKVQGHSLTLTYDISDDLTLKSISAYRKMDQHSGGNDIDGGNWVNPLAPGGTPFCLICSVAVRRQQQYSQEFQLLGTGERHDWILGGYYFSEKGRVNNPTFATRLFPDFASGPVGPATLSVFGLPDYFLGEFVTMANSAWAIYGHLNYNVTEKLKASVGLRYSADRRVADDHFLGLKQKADFNHTDGEATLQYSFTPDINAYAKVATGYLTGGILRGQVFEPETIVSYEAGVKSQFWNNRARLNVSAFQNDRKNLQTTNFGVTGLVLLNQAGTTKTKGVEIEGSLVPVRGLHLDGSFGYVDVDFAQEQNLGAPSKNLVLSARYDFPTFSNGAYVSARVDTNWQSRYSGLTLPLPSSPFNDALTRAIEQGDQWDVSARVSLMDLPVAGRKARISVWGRNLTNNDQLEFSRSLFGYIGGSFQVPRTYGVDIGLSF